MPVTNDKAITPIQYDILDPSFISEVVRSHFRWSWGGGAPSSSGHQLGFLVTQKSCDCESLPGLVIWGKWSLSLSSTHKFQGSDAQLTWKENFNRFPASSCAEIRLNLEILRGIFHHWPGTLFMARPSQSHVMGNPRQGPDWLDICQTPVPVTWLPVILLPVTWPEVMWLPRDQKSIMASRTGCASSSWPPKSNS